MAEGLKPTVGVLVTDGTNCEMEMAHALTRAGANPKIVHINDLKSGDEKMAKYQGWALPGGFSYGDDIASGKVQAIEMYTQLGDQISDYVENGRGPVFGVCNGFQVLVRTGLIPFDSLGQMQATLRHNKSGKFECRPVQLLPDKESMCVIMKTMKSNQPVSLMVANGEGNFYSTPDVLDKMEANGQIFYRYMDSSGNPTMEYPYNPSGSSRAIAGACDTTGRVFGMMPHFERFTEPFQQTNNRRLAVPVNHGLQIAQAVVDYMVNSA
jgi:phosphoribosylformylglycinamidine synthase